MTNLEVSALEAAAEFDFRHSCEIWDGDRQGNPRDVPEKLRAEIARILATLYSSSLKRTLGLNPPRRSRR